MNKGTLVMVTDYPEEGFWVGPYRYVGHTQGQHVVRPILGAEESSTWSAVREVNDLERRNFAELLRGARLSIIDNVQRVARLLAEEERNQ